MSTETEIKVRLDDREGFKKRLESLRPLLVSPRHFEDNFVLDFADQKLSARRCLLRMRKGAGASLLTFKGPARPEGRFKVREELETTVGDASVMLQVLQRMGLSIWFRYQKYRCEYLVAAPGMDAEKIQVVLDETPVGDFAEFEGSEAGIHSVASAMGFDETEYIRDSYYSIYLAFCREQVREPGDMIFPVTDQEQTPNI